MIKHPASLVVGVVLLYFFLLAWLWWELEKGSETLNFTTAYFLFANFIVVWWYAWLTRGILEESRIAAAAASEQLKLARARALNDQKIGWSVRKPPVFTFAKDSHLWIANVGGGPALNVFYLGLDGGHSPIGLGALGVGQERPLPSGLNQPIAVWRHILVAEGVSSRTRRWNPTLNVGIATALTAHEIGPLHDAVKMGDDAHWTLEMFLAKNGDRLRQRLTEVTLPAATD
ncbi:MAG: hypothetical protein ACRDFA_12190 [bacterium]